MRTIGGYIIRGLLGKGGMGAVYKVEHPVLGKLVALKLLDPVDHLVDVLGLDALRAQFLREARIMAGIRHPHVSQVWDYGEDKGRPFFVMEYACDSLGSLMGETYRVEAPSRRLPPLEAMDYALQTLDGLARLHHAGVIHRDIKPYNLLLTEENRVKIIDFGLSKLRGETGQDRTGQDGASQGGAGQVKVGTPYYAAPEQEENPEAAGPQADCYAVGVLLFRMLAGVLPHEELEETATARLAWLEAWARLDPELARSAREFFVTALHHDPQRRHPDANRMAAELAGLRDQFREAMDAVCTLPEEDRQDRLEGCMPCEEAAAPSRPRATPLRTGPGASLADLGLDVLGRPLVPPRPCFQIREDGTVLDRAHGLLWQRGGSSYPCGWREALALVERLDAEAGPSQERGPWRLPTLEEAATLVDATRAPGMACADACFNPAQTTCWTADRRTWQSAWRLHAAMGFLHAVDLHCLSHVRAVASLKEVRS